MIESSATAKPPAGGPGALVDRIEEALVAVRRAIKDLAFYPMGHPALGRSLENCHAQLRALADLEAPLILTVTREGIAHSRGAVGKDNPTLRQFAADLFLRRIQEIRFAPGLSPEDLLAFLRMLSIAAKELRAEGGAQRYLEAQGVQGIAIRDLEYRKEAAPAAARPPPPAAEQPPLEVAEPEAGDLSPMAPEPSAAGPPPETAEPAPSSPLTLLEQMLSQFQPPEPEAEKDEAPADLETLLGRIETATDERDYGRISVEIEAKAKEAVAARDTATLIRIVSVYAQHIQPESSKSEAIKDRARDAIDILGDPEAVTLLLDTLCEREVPEEDALILALTALGEAAIRPLISHLCLEEGVAGRRRLIAALSQFGPAAVPHVAQALHEQPWPAVRVLLSFLEQTGGPEAAAAVEAATRSEDRRIRREAVKVLGRIGGPEAAGRLLETLGDGDAGVRLQAVIGLGVVRDPRAVPPLLHIAQQGVDAETRRAAIGALGTIGDRAVVPALATLLSKRRWFRPREPDEIRVVAAQALGSLGGPEAIAALRAERRWGKGPLRDACAKALKRATAQDQAKAARIG